MFTLSKEDLDYTTACIKHNIRSEVELDILKKQYEADVKAIQANLEYINSDTQQVILLCDCMRKLYPDKYEHRSDYEIMSHIDKLEKADESN